MSSDQRRHWFDAIAPARPAAAAKPARPGDPAIPVRPRRPARPGRPVRPLDWWKLIHVLLASLALLLLAVLVGWACTRPIPPYHLAAPVGHRTLHVPLDVELVTDESGSNSTSDPHGLRNSEGAEVISWLSRYGGHNDQVGVVQFSNIAVPTLPLTPVRAAGPLVEASTRPDPRVAGGGTDIAAGISLGEQSLTTSLHRARRLIILFTDGASNTTVTIPGVIARAAGTDIYLIALDADGTFDQSKSFWQSLGLRGIKTIKTANRGSVAKSIANAILSETGQRLPK